MKTTVIRATNIVKLIIATKIYGNCLPIKNSNLLTGAAYKLVIDPVSFSLTTPNAVNIVENM